jgi:hypothetical protein
MTEELITFETAKLAKEKGFDELTKTLYITDKDTTRLAKANNSKRTNSNYIELEDYKVYSAPTQSLLQKWLREKYGVHVTPFLKSSGYEILFMEMSEGYPFTTKPTAYEGQSFETYEEALELGLRDRLEHLKI